MKSFDLLSVRLFELAARTQLVPAENCDSAGHSEPKELVALGSTREERSSNGDRQGEGSDAATQKQQQREEVRFVVHGSLLGSFEIEAQHAVIATRFGLQCLVRQPLDLELTFVGRKLAPSAYTALVNAERSSDGGLGAVVADNIRGLHET